MKIILYLVDFYFLDIYAGSDWVFAFIFLYPDHCLIEKNGIWCCQIMAL
jgi:hypothetical protein